jgi:ribosomal protein L14
MFNKNTKIRLNDNSGAIFFKCIHSYNNVLNAGSVILGTITSARPNRKVKKSDLYPALILCSPRLHRRFSGFHLKAVKTNAVLLKKQEKLLLASRVKSFCFLEVRFAGFARISSISFDVY